MIDSEVYEIRDLLDEMINDEDILTYNRDKLLRILEIFSPIIESTDKKAITRKYENLRFNYLNYAPAKEIAKTINALNGAIHLYENAESDLKTFDHATQDILHAIEMAELTEEEQDKLFKELRDVRQNRRACKNFLELTATLNDFAVRNRPIIKELQKIQSMVEKLKATIEGRVYRPREELGKTALAMAFEKANKEYMSKDNLAI